MDTYRTETNMIHKEEDQRHVIKQLQENKEKYKQNIKLKHGRSERGQSLNIHAFRETVR